MFRNPKLYILCKIVLNQNSMKLLSHYVSINFLYWTLFLFFSFRLLLLSTQCLSLAQPCIFCQLPSILFQSFCFLVLFGILRMLVTVIKAKFSLWKTLITLVKLQSVGKTLPFLRTMVKREIEVNFGYCILSLRHEKLR